MTVRKNGAAAIKSGSSKMNNDSFLSFSSTVHTSLKGNPNFTNPVPSLKDYKLAIDDFSRWCDVAKEGTRNDKRFRDKSRQSLDAMTKKLAEYVTSESNGDVLMLGTSGFPLVKNWEPSPALPVPENLKLSNPGTGEILVSVKGVKNCKLYLFQYSEAEDGNWTSITATKRKLVVSGLTPTKTYWFRVAAAGVRGQITYSVKLPAVCA